MEAGARPVWAWGVAPLGRGNAPRIAACRERWVPRAHRRPPCPNTRAASGALRAALAPAGGAWLLWLLASKETNLFCMCCAERAMSRGFSLESLLPRATLSTRRFQKVCRKAHRASQLWSGRSSGQEPPERSQSLPPRTSLESGS